MSGLGERGSTKNVGRGIPEADDASGVEPDRMRSIAPANPARGKAQGRIGLVAYQLRDADRRWESSPGVNATLTQPNPTKTNRGESEAETDTWARLSRNARVTHPREQTCEGQKPMSAAGRNAQIEQIAQKEGGSIASGKAANVCHRVAEHHARESDWCMTRADGTIEAVALELDGPVASARNRIP